MITSKEALVLKDFSKKMKQFNLKKFNSFKTRFETN